MKAKQSDEDRYTQCPECREIVSGDTEMRAMTALIGHRLSEHAVLTKPEEEFLISGSVTFTITVLSEADQYRMATTYNQRKAAK
jgi:hypothetical protein